MCTIIKVKRKITDELADCLVIECKKKKLAPDETTVTSEKTGASNPNLDQEEQVKGFEVVKQILKYAGSSKNEVDLNEKILNINSKKSIHLPINHTKEANGSVKAKEVATESGSSHLEKEKPHQNYVMINKKRGLNKSTSNNGSKDEWTLSANEKKKARRLAKLGNLNIIDVVPSDFVLSKQEETSFTEKDKISCNGIEMEREKVNDESKQKEEENEKFIYDIYYVKNSDIHLDLLYSNNYEIKSHNLADLESDDLLNDENSEDNEEIYNDEDEDSNDEGNWRNDYPDDEENDDDEHDYNEDDDDFYDQDYNEYNNEFDDEDDEYSYKKLSNHLKKLCKIDKAYYNDEDDEDGENYADEKDYYNKY